MESAVERARRARLRHAASLEAARQPIGVASAQGVRAQSLPPLSTPPPLQWRHRGTALVAANRLAAGCLGSASSDGDGDSCPRARLCPSRDAARSWLNKLEHDLITRGNGEGDAPSPPPSPPPSPSPHTEPAASAPVASLETSTIAVEVDPVVHVAPPTPTPPTPVADTLSLGGGLLGRIREAAANLMVDEMLQEAALEPTSTAGSQPYPGAYPGGGGGSGGGGGMKAAGGMKAVQGLMKLRPKARCKGKGKGKGKAPPKGEVRKEEGASPQKPGEHSRKRAPASTTLALATADSACAEPAPHWRRHTATDTGDHQGSCRGGGDDDGQQPQLSGGARGAELWGRARAVRMQVKLTKRWHRDVDRWYKRLLLTCTQSHTLLAGLVYRGAAGFSRAQTVQILSNSLVLELVVLCVQYAEDDSEDSTAKVEVNIVNIIVSGAVAALICIPGMMIFAAAFHPRIIINLLKWQARLIMGCPGRVWRARRRIARAIFCWPCMLRRTVARLVTANDEKERRERRRVDLERMHAAHTARKMRAGRLRAELRSSSSNLSRSLSRSLSAWKRVQSGGSARCSSSCDSAAAGVAAEGAPSPSEASATHAVPLSTQLRFAATGLATTAASGATGAPSAAGAVGRRADELADARWGVLCSTPVVQTMQREQQRPPPPPPALQSAAEREHSVIYFMRKKLHADRAEERAERDAHLGYGDGDDDDDRSAEGGERPERIFRYDSLNEHLVALSLSRAIAQKEWQHAQWLMLGWLANHVVFTAMLLVFLVYGCVFEELSERDNSQLLMYSWGWSLMQRFVVNEPVIILIGVLLPMLFATECCANMCTESCNNALGVGVATCITFLRRMRRA